MANSPPVSMTPAAHFSNSFASVVDNNTGSKFPTSVNDTDGKLATGGKQWEQLSTADNLK